MCAEGGKMTGFNFQLHRGELRVKEKERGWRDRGIKVRDTQGEI